MDYEFTYNPNLDAVEVATHGLADLDGLKEMNHRIAEACERERSASILVDHSDLDVSRLSMSDVEALSRTAASFKHVFGNRKCAHVVSKDSQYGLVRAWEIMVDLKGLDEVDARTFRDRDEAVGWLESGS
jgi:hypothetical protein